MSLLDLHLLLLIIAANAAPILANHIAGWLPATPIDAGRQLWDGQPLFGKSKTWRGLFFALLTGLLVGLLLNIPVLLALSMAALAMLGDLFSSFCKRRMGLAPSSKAVLLDQIPECALPALAALLWLDLPVASLVWIVFLFVVFELGLSPLAYRLRIRKRPY